MPPTTLRRALRRRRLALSGLALVLAGLGSTAVPAAAGTPVISQVKLTTSVDGSRLTATTTVRSTVRLSASELGVCVRSRTGKNYDLPRLGAVQLGPTPVSSTGQRTLPSGDYLLGTCVRTAVGWQALPGWRTVRVGAVASVPVPVTPVTPPTPVQPRPTGPSGAWSLRLDQTFGAGRLDRSVWRASRYGADDTDESPFNPDLEDALFSSRNVAVAGDGLTLRTTAGGANAGGRSYRYRSGTVSTEGTFTFGDDSYVEARVRIPRDAGLWPAFWAVPSGDWPPEVDMFEFFDTGTDTRPAFNYHHRDGAGQLRQTGPRRYGDPAVDYRTGWHTYGLQRTDGRLVPWLDGVAYPDVAATGLGDTRLFLILNLSVRRGSSLPGGESMDVSHVRAWQRG